MAVSFNYSKHDGYRERTIENAEFAPVTIAFAVDFESAGEKLTKRSVEQAGHKYIPVQLYPTDIKEWSHASRAADIIVKELELFNDWGKISVNIAGNGLYSFPSFINQEDLDVFMMRTLMLIENRADVEIRHVRSGGQTGIDEAGVKAADMLGMVASVNGPKDHKFRLRLGHSYKDITSKELFERRFSTEQRHRRHLEPLAELNKNLQLFPLEQRQALLRGESVQLRSGKLAEIAENSEGQDRLWCGENLFNRIMDMAECPVDVQHNFYFQYLVKYDEYMSDSIGKQYVYANTVDEAERIVELDKVKRLVDGDHFPDIISVEAVSLVVDGNQYKIDSAELLNVTDMNSYCHNLLNNKPDSINIWHSAGENADLSNFAIRPFDFRVSENDYVHFQSVEQAFQYMKTSPSFSECPDDVRHQIQKAILSTTDGAKLRELGGVVPGLNIQSWNQAKGKLMHDMIWLSFDENPEAKERLISTSDVKLTHRQDRSTWRFEFPKILSQVRYDLIRRQKIKESYDSMRYVSDGKTIHFYEGMIEPHKDVIFVFGSNYEGRHGAGAAKVAREKFGAIYGQAEGLQGNSYGLPTKDLRVKENNGYRSVSKDDIIDNIKAMYRSAEANFTKTYMVAYTNPPEKKSLSGYSGKEMIEMFIKAGPIPYNVQFSNVWKEEMTRQIKASKGKVI